MFSYTDDAIVTSSPTGRHLSTVIRRPAAIGPLDWSEHADQVCKVLNELDGKAKAHSLSLHMQTCGRVKRPTDFGAVGDTSAGAPMPRGPSLAELIDRGYVAPSHRHMHAGAQPRNPVETCALLELRIADMEKQLDDATTKLCAAQMLLEQADGKIATLERRIVDYRTAATNRGN